MLRLWAIRHVRWAVLRWRAYRAAARAFEADPEHAADTPHPDDLAYLDRIWQGED